MIAFVCRKVAAGRWKKRSKKQSPSDPIVHHLPTLFINSRQNLLTTQISMSMRLPKSFHQGFSNFIGDWSSSGAGYWKTCPFVPQKVRFFH